MEEAQFKQAQLKGALLEGSWSTRTHIRVLSARSGPHCHEDPSLCLSSRLTSTWLLFSPVHVGFLSVTENTASRTLDSLPPELRRSHAKIFSEQSQERPLIGPNCHVPIPEPITVARGVARMLTPWPRAGVLGLTAAPSYRKGDPEKFALERAAPVRLKMVNSIGS